MSLVQDTNVILEVQHHQFNHGAHHKHLLQDSESKSEYDAYYAHTAPSWITYEFKDEQVSLAGLGFGSATCGESYQPDQVRVLGYSSDQESDSEASEVGSWKLNYNNEYRSTEKFALKEEVSVRKLKFEFTNSRKPYIYLARIRVYVIKDD